MSVKLFLPTSLSHLSGGKDLFEVSGKTVGECLDQLVGLVHLMKGTIFYDQADSFRLLRCWLTKRVLMQKVWQNNYATVMRFKLRWIGTDEREVLKVTSLVTLT